jgi:hypothetical protein
LLIAKIVLRYAPLTSHEETDRTLLEANYSVKICENVKKTPFDKG